MECKRKYSKAKRNKECLVPKVERKSLNLEVNQVTTKMMDAAEGIHSTFERMSGEFECGELKVWESNC